MDPSLKPTSSEANRPRACDGVVTFPLDDDLVLCQESDGQTFVVNRTGAFIWSLCDGSQTRPEIAQSVADTFGIPDEQASKDVDELLDALQRAGLLVTP